MQRGDHVGQDREVFDCLRSVKDFADEMVLLDTGSVDGTISLAQACGARVERMEWPGDFAPARNAALEHVSGDWVLVLDADEKLRSEAIPQLKALGLILFVLWILEIIYLKRRPMLLRVRLLPQR